ncbi:MAG: GNAT family N-acetyltransferase [Spirochaetes bacterium]|nr:GNAT family N-acetyltransferase [Spirochaetota bacterium]
MYNKTRYHIRKADEKDIPEMVDLLVLLFSLEADFTINTGNQTKGLEFLLKDKNSHVLVLENENEKIIGMTTMQILISTSEGGRVGLIEDVIISNEYRGKGAGKAIINEIKKLACDLKLTRLQLLADKNNTNAIEFYKKIGWRITDLICLRQMIK